MTVSQDRAGSKKVTRRALLQGQLGRSEPAHQRRTDRHTTMPLTKEGRSLPAVIAWLDPEMRASTHRGLSQSGRVGLLRPPGALAEADFMTACSSCPDCVKACPHDAIVLAADRLGALAGTPVIDPARVPCLMCEDFPCIEACDTGALRLEAAVPLGLAQVSPMDCLNRMGTPCSVCVERCPVPDAIHVMDDLPAVQEGLCTGCGVCAFACPAPTRAIMILPNPSRPTQADVEQAAAKAVPAAEGESHIVLPELREAELDEQGLLDYFRDLSLLASAPSIQTKGHAKRRADAATSCTLDEARLLLSTAGCRALQLSYQHEEQLFIDTLMRVSGGYRLVRMPVSNQSVPESSGSQ